MKLGIITDHNAAGIQKVRKYGLDYAEMDVNADDISYIFNEEAGIKKAMQENSVEMSAIGRWGRPRINNDGSINLKEQKQEFDLIDLCKRLSCPVYMLTVNYVDGISYYSNITAAINYISSLIDYAKDEVKVCVVNCSWNNYVTNPREWSIILRHLPKLGIKFDSSHSINGGRDYRAEALEWGDRFYHVHLKGTVNINGVHLDDPPAGMDMTNWPELISILRAKKYKGVLSLEPHSGIWQGELGEQGIKYSIEYFKKLLFIE
ncbi:MAG: hypothetical protein A2Y17_03255 [Clostridiales bacterium GWF2_38_85]|nr:MAG: hypothetical protein A2Y17_03255 [Clostridiales bacterium GWF2_38_85]HBL85225.1 hypothetical protein [Clostridiales bacterium]